jgi:hypothetical protein
MTGQLNTPIPLPINTPSRRLENSSGRDSLSSHAAPPPSGGASVSNWGLGALASSSDAGSKLKLDSVDDQQDKKVAGSQPVTSAPASAVEAVAFTTAGAGAGAATTSMRSTSMGSGSLASSPWLGSISGDWADDDDDDDDGLDNLMLGSGALSLQQLPGF